MLKCLVIASILALSTRSFAYSYDTFYGWSPDHSFYLESDAGTDTIERAMICLSDAKAGSRTWPKAVERPDEGHCTTLCNMDEDVECDEAAALEKAMTWVELAYASPKGPHGETVSVKLADQRATFRVLLKGAELARATIDTEQSLKGYKIIEVYWRGDGGAVAVLLALPSRKGDEVMDGWPPPRYVEVIPLAGTRVDAKAANARGLKLHRAKKYAEAAKEYRSAIAADASYVFAHYNLACGAALVGDRATAVSELKWLTGSQDAAAKKMLTHGRTDPDLASVRADPEVRALLGLD
jgi:hypothetical protein